MQNIVALSTSPRSKTGKFDRPIKIWTFGLMVSALIGVFSGVTGLLINLFFLLPIAENKGLMGFLSLALLVAAFPLLGLTAHCLDRLCALDKARRLEYCRQNGLADDCESPDTKN